MKMLRLKTISKLFESEVYLVTTIFAPAKLSVRPRLRFIKVVFRLGLRLNFRIGDIRAGFHSVFSKDRYWPEAAPY